MSKMQDLFGRVWSFTHDARATLELLYLELIVETAEGVAKAEDAGDLLQLFRNNSECRTFPLASTIIVHISTIRRHLEIQETANRSKTEDELLAALKARFARADISHTLRSIVGPAVNAAETLNLMFSTTARLLSDGVETGNTKDWVLEEWWKILIDSGITQDVFLLYTKSLDEIQKHIEEEKGKPTIAQDEETARRLVSDLREAVHVGSVEKILDISPKLGNIRCRGEVYNIISTGLDALGMWDGQLRELARPSKTAECLAKSVIQGYKEKVQKERVNDVLKELAEILSRPDPYTGGNSGDAKDALTRLYGLRGDGVHESTIVYGLQAMGLPLSEAVDSVGMFDRLDFTEKAIASIPGYLELKHKPMKPVWISELTSTEQLQLHDLFEFRNRLVPFARNWLKAQA